MTVPSVLLFLLGVLGATDILLYHSISHGIPDHHDSRAELFTHFLRGPTYAALFLLVPNFAFRGCSLSTCSTSGSRSRTSGWSPGAGAGSAACRAASTCCT